MQQRNSAVYLALTPIVVVCLLGSKVGIRTAKSQESILDIKTKITNIVNIGSDKLESDDFFGAIVDVHLDDSNNIYVMDGIERFIAKFDLRGNLIGKFPLPKGEGPGEYLRPKCFTFDGTRFAIGDINLMRVTILDQRGKYLNSFRVEERPGDIELYGNHLFLSGLFDYSNNRVHVYDIGTKKKILSICPANAMTKEIASFGEIDSFKIMSNRLYFSRFFPYEISIYSLNGKLEKKITRANAEFEKKLERDKITKSLRFVIGTATILTSGKHFINVLKGRNIEKRAQYSVFDIFKESGEYVTSFSATDLGEVFIRIADININGYLVVDSVEPYPRVRVFLIKDLLN